MSLKYVVEKADGSTSIRLTDDDIMSHTPVKTHTGVADLQATIKPHRELEPYAQRQDRLHVKWNGVTKWTGYLLDISHDKNGGRGRIEAVGIAKRLEETRPDYSSLGGPVSYSQIALSDAISDYWSRTPFNTVSVTPGSSDVVASGSEIQSASTGSQWLNISSIGGGVPAKVQNNRIEILQSAFTIEGEDFDSGTATGDPDALGAYSGGNAVRFDEVGDTADWTFTPAYDIPASAVGVQVRDDDHSDNTVEVEWSLNNSTLDTVPADINISLGWEDIGNGFYSNTSGYSGGDLQAGTTYTLTAECTSIGSSGVAYVVDVVCVYDNRYSYTFDNDNGGGGGYLDGPELYPDSVSVELDETTTSYNITAADVTTTWNDTSNQQAIAVSNDGGSSYLSSSNTASISKSFSGVGRTAQVKFTLSRYGSRSTATPKTGFNGQTVDDYSLKVDGDSTVVIDELELSRNHFDNLQKLHDYGDFIWVIQHDDKDISNLTVESFPRGAETKPAPPEFDNPKNQQPEIQSGAYYNAIYLEGALDSNGDRPSYEAVDTQAKDNDGRKISPGVLRDHSITTEAGAVFRAEALLSAAQSNNDLVGTITVPPVITDPGYSYPVDFGDGEKYKTCEEVRLTQSRDTHEAVFDFVARKGLSEDISDLKWNSRDLGDQV